MKIAIIRLSALGDVVVSASMVACIKEIFKDCEIDWYVDERFGDILKDSPLVNVCVIPLKRYIKTYSFLKLFKIFKDMRQKQYDYVIDMQGLLKSAIIGKIFKTKCFVGFDRNSAKEGMASFFYTKKVCIDYEESILKRNAKLLYEALIPAMDFEQFMELALQCRKNIFGYTAMADNFIENELFKNKKNILLLLEASIVAKSYSAKNYIKLLDELQGKDYGFLLLCYQDIEKAKEIFEACKTKVELKILSKINLDQIKALVDKVELIIGGDTGITHLGWAMQNASITLYGNTPLQRFQLIGEKNISLSGNKMAKYDKNDLSINLIEPSAIIESMEKLI